MKSATQTTVHEIEISEVSRGVYRVIYQGEMLLVRSTDPEWDAARELVARGHVGTLRTRRAGSRIVSFDLPLGRAAQLVTNGTAGFRTFEPKRIEKFCPKEAA